MQIKKTPNIIKRLAEVPSSLKELVQHFEASPIEQLVPQLSTFSSTWERPRGDLCAWIPLLNRFDVILEKAVEKYKLDQEFPEPIPIEIVDEQVLVCILDFSAFLLEKCSNRGIYCSVKHASSLLNSISPSIVSSALNVCVKIAQRFAQSRTGRQNITSIEQDKIAKFATLVPSLLSNVSDKSGITISDFINPSHKWESQFSSFSLQYYVRSDQGAHQPLLASPTTPTRPSSVKHKEHLSSLSSSENHSVPQEGLAELNFSSKEVKETSDEQLLKKIYSVVPKEYWFVAVNRLRLAKACVNTEKGLLLRRELCKIQCLSLGFAACTFGPSTLDGKILSKCPTLLRQIADLISAEKSFVPSKIRILALDCLDYYCSQDRLSEVLTALSANVSHGTLMSVIRTTIKDLKSNVDVDEEFTSTLFSVVVQLVSQQAAGSMLVTAGLVPLLLELIQLDSKYSRTLAIAVELLDHIVLDVPSTFAAFSQARGVDILIEVIQKTVEYNLNPENRGNPPDYCVVDYALPYHRCQLIRALLGFVCNILTHTRSAERVHSLVDSALMKVAKDVILNASFLGCRVVSLAFQYLSNMLENDPSSFNIMNEAKVVHIAISNFDTLLGLSNSYFVPIAKFISALCHNEHGLSMVQDEHILRRYFSILSTHIINNDSFKNLGTTFDILTSDHTDLRPIIIEELLRLLKEVPNSLNALTHSRRFYFESEPVSPVAEQEIEMSSSHDIMATMTNVVHFLEGFLKNHLTRVEFIKQKGVSHLLRLFEVNNLPYEFAYSHTSHILSGTLRSLFDLDIDSDYIQEEILSKVRAGIQRVEDIVLDEFDMETGVQPEKRDAFVRELSRLNSILYAFYQIVFINPGTGYRIMFIMDKIAKNSSGDKDIILRLGRIVRYCIWQDALTVSGLPETVEEASRPLHVDLSTRSFKTLYDSDEFKKIKELESKLEEVSSPLYNEVKVMRFLANATSTVVCKVFSEFAGICTNDRAMSSRKKNGLKIAEFIGTSLRDQLFSKPLLNLGDSELRYARYHTLLSTLTFVYRTLFKTAGSTITAYFGLLIFFKQKGGIQRLTEIMKQIWFLPVEDEAKDAESSLLLNCETMGYLMLTQIVSYKSVLENSRAVTLLTSSDNDKSRRDYFNPNQFFVECRIIVLHGLLDLWNAESLRTQHPSVCQLLFDILNKLLYSVGEDGCASNSEKDRLPRELSWEYICPSEDKTAELVHRGVSESAARSALTKYGDRFNDALDSLRKSSNDDGTIDDSDFHGVEIPLGTAPFAGDQKLVTVSDLVDLREAVQKDLLRIALDTALCHPEAVYAISGLLVRAYTHSAVGGTRSERQRERLNSDHQRIVASLLESLDNACNVEDRNDKDIASISHLIGLVIQDSGFFSGGFQDLINHCGLFADLLDSDKSWEKGWYPKVLLIMERLLSNLDIPKPEKRNFEAGFPDSYFVIGPTLDAAIEERIFQHFSTSRPFRDDICALAISRLLVHFSKKYDRARALLNNGAIANLLRSLKQFSGSTNFDKLETAIIIVLRHAIETPEIIRDIMTNEIKAWFNTSKVIDAIVFIKSHHHLINRSPEIFVEVASDVCAFNDLSLSSSHICLKEYAESRREKTFEQRKEAKKLAAVDREEGEGEVDASADAAEDKDTPMVDAVPTVQENSGANSIKFPKNENQSGVIQLLLTELFNLKREDVFHYAEKSDKVLLEVEAKKEKVEFKASERSAYVYCSTLLRALAELLGSYNSCKVELIGFSRKNTTQAFLTTPLSKPRSHALNYFLHELLPVGTLRESSSDLYREWYSISSMASAVLINLMATPNSKTRLAGEIPIDSTLTFVRRFALDVFLKVLKDVHSSSELIDYRYSMFASLSQVCHYLLSKGSSISSSTVDRKGDAAAMAKIMYEKKFASIFTATLADLDLNYPYAKKVVRVSLRFLNKLARVALEIPEDLHDNQKDKNVDVEVIANVDDDYREDTPDLFRNSTLGMFDVNESMYDEDEELVEGHEIDPEEEEMDYDNYDEALSDVEEEEDTAAYLDYNNDEDDSEGSDESDIDEDDDMGVEIIVESEDEDEDMDEDEDSEDFDEDDESDWESFDDDVEDEDDDELALVEPRESEGESRTLRDINDFLRAMPRPFSEDSNGFLDEDAEDSYARPYNSEIVVVGSEDEEEESEDDYQDMDFEVPTRISMNILPGSSTSNVVQGEAVINPLVRNGARRSTLIQGRNGSRPDGFHAITQMIDRDLDRTTLPSFLSDLVGQFANRFLPGDHQHHHHFDHFSVGGDEFDLEGLIRHGTPFRSYPYRRNNRLFDESFFDLQKVNVMSTNGRWQEAALMFGVYNKADVCGRVSNAIFNRMIPYTKEQAQKEQEMEKELERIDEETRRKREEKERKVKEKREQEERCLQEEEESRQRQADEERARLESESMVSNHDDEHVSEDAVMETVSHDGDNEGRTSDERVFVSIGGREIDITGMGIDPTFLEALPDDMREEVFTQHLREMRTRRNDGGSQNAREMEPEFLEALPESIREELLAQEVMDSRLRSDDDSDGHGPVDMDVASFLATLEPSLRQTLLLEQGGELSLSSLPSDIADEARELRSRTIATFPGADGHGTTTIISGGGNLLDLGNREAAGRTARHGIRSSFDSRNDDNASDEEIEEEERSEQRRMQKQIASAASLQLVDRSGIAALIRLIYLPQGSHAMGWLNELLSNLSWNKQNRLDMLHFLLHVIQDGSGDRHYLEKGFTHTSHKARAGISDTPSKTPSSIVKATPSRAGGNLVLSQEVSPVTVMQQALETLEHLVVKNGNVRYFFLSEHENPVGLKRNKYKGKGKEKEKEKEREVSREFKFPVNILFNMLDNPVVKENNLTLEMLTGLLLEICRSLPTLIKQTPSESAEKKEEETEEKKSESKNSDNSNAEGVSGENATASGSNDNSASTSNNKNKKSPRMIDPPYIPDYNLKKISSILTAKECSSKAFQQTLAVMQHLCIIPGVKDLFGNELSQRGISVGPIIVQDLKVLLENVKKVERGSDLQGAVLSKFSSSSSDQAKLLRVLTAIDYLFDASTREDGRNAEKSRTSKEDKEKTAVFIKSLYDSMTFGSLWETLSECLRLIQDRQDMIHVATALLPLIESLMVICKHSRINEVDVRDSQRLESKKEFAIDPLVSLFFSFTDEHRKILNQIVRNNPKLMIGSFSILVKNPKALEFDNKRRYFYRRVYPSQEHAGQVISLNVRRDQVFLDSYKALYFKLADEIKKARLSVRFQGEEGVDAGGVTREWYQVLSRQIFNPDYALFSPVAADKTTFHPNRTSWVNPEHLSFFKFVGRIIGKAIYDFRVLDCHFSRAVYKKILGKPVSIKDMETLDLEYYKSLQWMLENDITDVITETFSVEADDYGEQKIIDLKPNGREIPVTEENKKEYVNLVVDYRLIKSVQDQMDHFLQGFHDIIPKDVISIFDEQELELLISGMPDIDLDDWRNNTEYHNYTVSSPQIKWFWRAVRSFDPEEKAKLLQFVTGTSKVPLNGFGELEGMNGVSKFNIHRDYGSKDRLPSSHTCFNQLDLPEYDSYEVLRSSLLTAISEGREGFGFA